MFIIIDRKVYIVAIHCLIIKTTFVTSEILSEYLNFHGMKERGGVN